MKSILNWLHLVKVYFIRLIKRIECWYRRTKNYKLKSKKEIMEWEKVKNFSLNYTKRNTELKENQYMYKNGVLEYNSDLIIQEDILYFICNCIYWITYKVDPIAITYTFYRQYLEEKRQENLDNGTDFIFNEVEMVVDFIFVEITTGKAGEIYQKVLVS